jgi:hypothetical protein
MLEPPPDSRRTADTWLASWLEACAELDRLQAGNPMLDAVIEEVGGRRIRVGDRWLHDFASCNYLGLDFDREVIEGIPAYLDRWGTHPGWSRMLGSPVLYEQIEAQLRELLGVEDALLLPTLTHIHASVIPVLASGGTVLLDARAHKTIHDGAVIARARGSGLQRFAHDDPDVAIKPVGDEPAGRLHAGWSIDEADDERCQIRWVIGRRADNLGQLVTGHQCGRVHLQGRQRAAGQFELVDRRLRRGGAANRDDWPGIAVADELRRWPQPSLASPFVDDRVAGDEGRQPRLTESPFGLARPR